MARTVEIRRDDQSRWETRDGKNWIVVCALSGATEEVGRMCAEVYHGITPAPDCTETHLHAAEAYFA